MPGMTVQEGSVTSVKWAVQGVQWIQQTVTWLSSESCRAINFLRGWNRNVCLCYCGKTLPNLLKAQTSKSWNFWSLCRRGQGFKADSPCKLLPQLVKLHVFFICATVSDLLNNCKQRLGRRQLLHVPTMFGGLTSLVYQVMSQTKWRNFYSKSLVWILWYVCLPLHFVFIMSAMWLSLEPRIVILCDFTPNFLYIVTMILQYPFEG